MSLTMSIIAPHPQSKKAIKLQAFCSEPVLPIVEALEMTVSKMAKSAFSRCSCRGLNGMEQQLNVIFSELWGRSSSVVVKLGANAMADKEIIKTQCADVVIIVSSRFAERGVCLWTLQRQKSLQQLSHWRHGSRLVCALRQCNTSSSSMQEVED